MVSCAGNSLLFTVARRSDRIKHEYLITRQGGKTNQQQCGVNSPPYLRAMPALPWLKAPQILSSCSSSMPTPLPTASCHFLAPILSGDSGKHPHGANRSLAIDAHSPSVFRGHCPAALRGTVIRNRGGLLLAWPRPMRPATAWRLQHCRRSAARRRPAEGARYAGGGAPVGHGDEEEAAGAVDGDAEADEAGPGELGGVAQQVVQDLRERSGWMDGAIEREMRCQA
jgi:hypothetical protein